MRNIAIILLVSLLGASCRTHITPLPSLTNIAQEYAYFRPSGCKGEFISQSNPTASDQLNRTKLKILEYPLLYNDSQTPFYYFNDEWIPGAEPDMVSPSVISKMDVKSDTYGNKSIFITIPPESVDSLKSKVNELYKGVWIDYDPVCEFPGGNGKLQEWFKENTRLPDGFEGSSRVVVIAKVQSDGTVVFDHILRHSNNESINREAKRLIEALPRFYVKYYTPIKEPIPLIIPITFQNPNAIYIR